MTPEIIQKAREKLKSYLEQPINDDWYSDMHINIEGSASRAIKHIVADIYDPAEDFAQTNHIDMPSTNRTFLFAMAGYGLLHELVSEKQIDEFIAYIDQKGITLAELKEQLEDKFPTFEGLMKNYEHLDFVEALYHIHDFLEGGPAPRAKSFSAAVSYLNKAAEYEIKCSARLAGDAQHGNIDESYMLNDTFLRHLISKGDKEKVWEKIRTICSDEFAENVTRMINAQIDECAEIEKDGGTIEEFGKAYAPIKRAILNHSTVTAADYRNAVGNLESLAQSITSKADKIKEVSQMVKGIAHDLGLSIELRR